MELSYNDIAFQGIDFVTVFIRIFRAIENQIKSGRNTNAKYLVERFFSIFMYIWFKTNHAIPPPIAGRVGTRDIGLETLGRRL